jgi:hypothetical protein
MLDHNNLYHYIVLILKILLVDCDSHSTFYEKEQNFIRQMEEDFEVLFLWEVPTF